VPALDILVNNAGVGLGARFLDTTLEDWEWVLQINLWGVIHGCHFFVPAMVKRKAGGHVVNVASAAGLLAMAELSAYSTSKFAVVGLSEALRDELEPHGICVSTICPGLINTAITRTSPLRGNATPPRDELVALYEKRNYGPEKVARAIVDAVNARRGIVPVTPEAWFVYGVKRAFPNSGPRMLRKLGDRLQKRK
jgi:NAD(P)-dependent dehydrogenase (short-subunit alcohol dehydrogenase family)